LPQIGPWQEALDWLLAASECKACGADRVRQHADLVSLRGAAASPAARMLGGYDPAAADRGRGGRVSFPSVKEVWASADEVRRTGLPSRSALAGLSQWPDRHNPRRTPIRPSLGFGITAVLEVHIRLEVCARCVPFIQDRDEAFDPVRDGGGWDAALSGEGDQLG